MKTKRLTDICVSTLIVILVAFTLMPAVARLQRSSAEAKCQSNMRRWAEAMSLYTADNYEFYPTNKTLGASVLTTDVPLTPDDATNSDGTPKRFQYGYNWVEALYPYVQDSARKTDQDWKALRACPNASTSKWPPTTGGAGACVTYGFNYNMAEKSRGFLHNQSKLMMLRELDRRFNSVLRPNNGSTGNSANAPNSPFLDTVDEAISMPIANPTNPNQHGSGSYIVFADGHVRYFTTEYFPDQANLTAEKCWDSETQQWYNYVFANPANETETRLNKSIAITP